MATGQAHGSDRGGQGAAKPEATIETNPLFSRPGEATELPANRLPDAESLPETAFQIVHDEAMLDGNARLNLATFVGTWMDEQAGRLYLEAADKNIVDKDEYPATARIEERCWRMLAHLWRAPVPAHAIGTSTVGSSEACMLAGLALKRRWAHARRAAGADASKPNLVMSSAVQVCWEKFCNYFDVEPRFVPVSPAHPLLDAAGVAAAVDENTIGVVAILGVTYTGRYEPVRDIAAALDRFHAERGLDIAIHVDGASGAMVAPFLEPQLEWDFRLDRVASINTSGHKYGLVYPGVGWVVWRSTKYLPADLVFNVSYLGGQMPTFGLNFSRPGAQVLLQYYQFLRLGFAGYAKVQAGSRKVARYLARHVGRLPGFEIVGDGEDLPVVTWRLADGDAHAAAQSSPDGGTPGRAWTLYHLAERLRIKGWLVPAYPLPADQQDVTVQRIVVRNGLSLDLARTLLVDIESAVAYLDALGDQVPDSQPPGGFHH